jgi:hypothetical protein
MLTHESEVKSSRRRHKGWGEKEQGGIGSARTEVSVDPCLA